jgi:hypothetical protein
MDFGALTYNQYMDNREKLSGYIKAALPEYECSLEDLEQSVRAYQRLPVGIFEDGSLIGFMVLEQSEDAIHITTLSGEFPEDWIAEVYAFVADIAQNEHKTHIQCGGRRGWIRRLKEYNLKHDGELLRVEI